MKKSEAVRHFFESLRTPGKEPGKEVHGIIIYKGNEKLVSCAPAPYSTRDRNHVYSMSKSFCSTALGLAYDRGILSPDEKIIDIFPEKCPAVIPENLKKLTLSHVLSMNTGMEVCCMPAIMASDDPVRAFLHGSFPYAPGTHFAYNTGATFLASACLTRRTGMTVFEYLDMHLLRYLGIDASLWHGKDEISEGGVGLHVSCEDAVKLAMLYRDGGVYNGRRYLSEDWVKLATSFHSDNSANGTVDWTSGYGYQFWINSRGGFRGDGAFGQLCIAVPERGYAAAVIAECGEMQGEIDAVFALFDALDTIEDPSSDPTCPDALVKFYPPASFTADGLPYLGKTYRFAENAVGYSYLRLDAGENGKYALTLGTRDYATVSGVSAARSTAFPATSHLNRISLISGVWVPNRIRGLYVKPTIEFTATHNDPLIGYACASREGERFTVTVRAVNCPHTVSFVITPNADGTLSFETSSLFCPDFHRVLTALPADETNPFAAGWDK